MTDIISISDLKAVKWFSIFTIKFQLVYLNKLYIMLDNLINLIKQHAGESIINNPAVPNEKNDVAIQETGNSIFDTLKSTLASGNFKDIFNMFSKGQADPSNPMVQQATTGAAANLQQKLGLDQQQATNIAGSLVPDVMNKLAQKTSDPSDNSFNIQDIFNKLSGGKTSGMNVSGLLTKFKSGLDKDGDGDVDFTDLKSAFSSGGGIMDTVKGLFK